ncbi:hypothetical protein PW52_14800 [Tamlana sedimentorum]|uniref:SPOR domain-containing protein n=1 Tax=Neotamlana sedimentorum TaxID=1435349 RepID=A0A0D7W272_9FLAO|nr:SPOR domain-containing protein [Tamlana sedimentorum]KJD33191.1 hypothetical protein PW52_14800 [Tamlana sedimentorum]
MKKAITLILVVLSIQNLVAQRIVFPNQNAINPYLDDPSYLAANGRYNMTGIIQASDTNTSQYLNAQLAPFDNFAFGLDYSNHSYQSYRYIQLFLNTRFKFNLGSEFHTLNIGASVGLERLNEKLSAKDNNFKSVYKLGLHYTNFNLKIGGFLTTYPIQNYLSLAPTTPLTSSNGYSGYLSYRIRVSDNFRITPSAKYHAYNELNIIEGVANLNFKGNYEMALSYKNDYSINAAISARLFKYFRISYSFENAIGAQNFNQVHSVGLSVDLTPKEQEIPEWLANVKRNREKLGRPKRKKEPKQEIVETTPIEEPEIIIKTETIEPTPEIATEVVVNEIPVMSEETPPDVINGNLKPGYYVILGSFVDELNANKEIERLKQKGIYARTGRKKGEEKFNYIYIDRYNLEEKETAIQRTFNKQKETGFEKVWLLRIK